MTLIRHELKQGWKSLAIWTAAIGAFIVTCLLIWPEMKSQMSGISSLFASMGAFTAAFGMDTLDFGSLNGFYGIECGNILGIGGALFAALLGISALAKEDAIIAETPALSSAPRRVVPSDRIIVSS